MKNELVLIDKIDKRLREKRSEVVFPLAANHRKELRQLRNTNVGNLNSRLNTIKTLKKEEYVKKYKDDIKKEIKNKEVTVEKLNKDWENRLKKIDALLKGRFKLEEETDMNNINLNQGYGTLNELKVNFDSSDAKRRCSFNQEEIANNVAVDEFNKKYDKSFQLVKDRIADIETKYEEAINFGDLEIVKELYYVMKNSEELFVKINKLVI